MRQAKGSRQAARAAAVLTAATFEGLERRQLLAAVTASLKLYDLSGNALPQTNGAYTIAAGTSFRVALVASVSNPNMTNGSLTNTALRNKPLGIETLTADILSSGKNVANPVTFSAGGPLPEWAGYEDRTPNGLAFGLTNVYDVDRDGDPDAAGAGFVNTGFTLNTNLTPFQYGAPGSASSTAPPMTLLSGTYKAISGGATKLTAKLQAVNVYANPTNSTLLKAVDVLGSSTSGSITINVTGGSTLGSIAGKAFKDANKNGVADSGEAGLGGATMFIDGNKNGVLDTGEATTTTDSSGNYKFAGLAGGSYRVRELAPSGQKVTAPSSGYYDVTVGSGQNVTGKNFANQPTSTGGGGGGGGASIAGILWSDDDKDGTKDSAEALLGNRKMFLDANKNGKLDTGEKTAITSSGGAYSFTGLAAGTYRVRRADTPVGYGFSTPSSGYYDVTLSSGQAVSGKNFGAIKLASTTTGTISGFLWSDDDKDGIKDSAEALLSNRKFFIDANKNGKLDSGEKTAVTNSAGVYTFTGLVAGTYRIRRADTPVGYGFSIPSSGYYDVTLSSGQNVSGKNFGAKKL
jgi:hypothetical protein